MTHFFCPHSSFQHLILKSWYIIFFQLHPLVIFFSRIKSISFFNFFSFGICFCCQILSRFLKYPLLFSHFYYTVSMSLILDKDKTAIKARGTLLLSQLHVSTQQMLWECKEFPNKSLIPRFLSKLCLKRHHLLSICFHFVH